MFRPTEVARRHDLGDHADLMRSDADSSGAFARDLVALGRSYGFTHCLLARFPKADSPEFSANLLVVTWPDELRLAYEQAEVFAGSALVQRLKQTVLPIFSVENLFLSTAASEARNPISALFEHHAPSGHLAFGLHDRHQSQYILVYSGRPTRPNRDELALMQLSAMELLDSGVESVVPRPGPKEKLSAREIECLRWSAAGKSSDEIAIILDISTHTVVSYLKSAMRKLEAVNRMQAVARACRYRLL
ncbi:LuxR family transcriptional regulator [Rhizobium sp. Root274]|uniref:helix-turn-helix transcriptional regulator n=1 Tax=unclassified Rhizobium TaxID=2613769 RepID=UPI0007126CD6|nr:MULTISPECIES: helix-turn-helix transcriptional regulator [unclassified Rhizobium]KQW29198.1 LuxR family transcriptional regulator [Rhizobium sp. Root1240]KRD29394.1 LuxR family transcriptional regulator [Rhizobium sp. Root274]